MMRSLTYDVNISFDISVIKKKHLKTVFTRIKGISSDFEGYLKRGEVSLLTETEQVYEHVIVGALELPHFPKLQGYRVIFGVSETNIHIVRIQYVDSIRVLEF